MPKLQAAQIAVTPFQQNCALIWDAETAKGVVVDPGGEVPRILAAIERGGFAVERILLTHGHLDHAGGAAALKRALEAKQGAPACISAPSTVASQFVVPPPQQKPVTPSFPLDASCAFTKRALFSISVRSFAWSSLACISRPSSSLPG
jgi:glyoxylase-like metal-dependent hydrolase (beta-lactamase superfamily II)